MGERAEQKCVSPTPLSMIYMVEGGMDQALEWLKQARQKRDMFLCWFGVSPAHLRVVSDSRIHDLLANMGLL